LWIKFAIDDFWTGLSNIRRLLELECDYLKLDSSLLKWIKKNDISSYKYLSHIYDMAKSLWLTVVAEWIEDIEIQEILEELWIEEYQWYYHWEPQANLI
jgi:EAL domain-containing protein (putative c-di-GMP-specific phosphodiesterase class I)